MSRDARSILFIHENHPAQFGGIARHLASTGWNVIFCTASARFPPHQVFELKPDGYSVVRYGRKRGANSDTHPFLATIETAILNAQGFARAALKIREGGFHPDVIVAHSGWGSGSFAKSIWPDSKLVQYLEWWYRYPPVDRLGGDAPRWDEDRSAATLCRNMPFLLDVQSADLILVPTEFQRAQIPEWIGVDIKVIHDGVDVEAFRPHREGDRQFSHPGLPDDAPIVTYATRGMEPMRGFPEFMRDLGLILEKNPRLHAVIAGSDTSHYGPRPSSDDTWKAKALRENDLDLSRVHFVGRLPMSRYRELLRRSAVHVYLTKPFVASWSLLDAMATGCALVVSDTEPVRELAIKETAVRVAFDKPGEIATAVSAVLSDKARTHEMQQCAREHVVGNYCARRTGQAREMLFANLANSSVTRNIR